MQADVLAEVDTLKKEVSDGRKLIIEESRRLGKIRQESFSQLQSELGKIQQQAHTKCEKEASKYAL